jgi:anaerobic magnesium-protoporphyrin IX monomethyl ester cyclase
LQKGEYLTDIPNMWFKTKDNIKKNKLSTLNSCQVLDELPYAYNQTDCFIYDFHQDGFKSFNKFDYTAYNGLLYRTIWTRGCPFNCSYCANNSFIKLDPDYRKLRYPSVNYIIEEIKLARAYHPYISTIAFYDDNFVFLPLQVIKEFCDRYRKEIKLPFVVFGFHPNLVDKEKVELLAEAGMNRMRMGIQSGSEETLKLYNRPTSIKKIKESSNILADAAKKYKMIPPAYDIISDNPMETAENIRETLKLIHEFKRPFTLTIFSLRIFPKTQLYDYVQKHPAIKEYFRESSYLDIQINIGNITLYLLATFKLPEFIFKRLLSKIADEKNNSKRYILQFYMVKSIYLMKRGIDHIYHLDFSTIVGKWTYYVWKFRH